MSTAEIPPTDPGQGAPAEPAPEPASEPEPQTTEPTPQDVQPEPGTEAQPDGGQGLLEPYLADVDETARPEVERVLNKYRQDSDAEVTKKFEQLNGYKQYADDPSQLEVPLSIYDNLVSDPVNTMKWIRDRYRDEAGIDLTSQLQEAFGVTGDQTQAQPAAETQPEATEEKPLTRADLDAWQEEQRQVEEQRKQQETQRQAVDGWIKEAAEQHGIDLSDDVTKEAVIKAASQTLPQYKHLGQDAGRQAILSATEAFKNRFGATAKTEPTPDPEPQVAKGGTAPAPESKSLETGEDRKAFMRDWLTRQPQE